MAQFNPSAIKPASKSAEFSKAAGQRSARDVLLAGIDSQVALFKDPKAEGRRWFTAGQKEIAFSLRYSNRALVLVDGEKQVVVPTDQFEAALTYYKGEVGKGVFDAQLAEMAKAVDARKDKMRATRAGKKAEPKAS